MKNLLKVKNISLKYQTPSDEITAIENLTFSCEEGSFTSIIGPSGCGKTTVLSVIAGLIKPNSGSVEFSSNGVVTGYMLQKDQLFPWRTIEKNVFLPLEIKKIKTEENMEYARQLLKKYGLNGFLQRYPSQLSGGMRQRVALIRTLVFKPDLLLLDEPFSALDAQTRLSVCDDVYGIIKEEKKTAILVTHDISEAISTSDEIVVLTERPAKVKEVYFPNINGNSPIKKRESAEFSAWFEKIWKVLNTNEKV